MRGSAEQRDDSEPQVRAPSLSPRERAILQLVASGLSSEEIGTALECSQHTVSAHMRNIMSKLEAQSRSHAVAIAMRRALIR
jgi:DNA-binding CsgD family transcriptional regulator